MVLAGDSPDAIPSTVGLAEGLILVVKFVVALDALPVILVAVLLLTFALVLVPLSVAASGSGLTSTSEPALLPLLLVLLGIVSSISIVITSLRSSTSK